ncbi:Xaa-Pro aminopeptidase [Halioxenophilus aromaticivorans]|uniref:Xaa-Pro aminopeptidase n=1 Tax=Halioxenophilus aromaticivorans TaxID=1306992 RepID=A0AAV3U5M6_9ALTE
MSTKSIAGEFARRRKDLMAMLEPNSIAIVATAEEKIRSRDTHFAFRPDSDFFYLSGFAEPGAVLALVPGREHGEFVMFVRDKDREKEIWDGYREGPEGVMANYGADDAFPISDIDEILPGLMEGRERLYYSLGRDPEFDRQIMSWLNALRAKERSGAIPPGEFLDLDHYLHDLRLFKSSAEAKLMRTAGKISAQAHVRAMQMAKPGVYEYQLQAEIEHEFAKNGAHYPAYSSIVGSGPNGCILHYIENTQKMQDGDLVLIDAGCEYQMYAADITRTFPVNGKFTEPQKQVYNVVLEAQFAAIEATKPGNHWNAPHEAAVRVITQGLVNLGLLEGDVDELIEQTAYRDFYMHRTGHWLGMDVHDVGDYKVAGDWRVLEPGMCLTIEPGIYIAPDNQNVAEQWRGIGIRIEDDVLVTSDGCEILTADVPKTVADIEALMAQ